MVEGLLPGRLLWSKPPLILYKDVVFIASDAVRSLYHFHMRQTSTQPGFWDAAATISIVTTSTWFAPLGTKVPIAQLTEFTILPPDTNLAHTLACRLWEKH